MLKNQAEIETDACLANIEAMSKACGGKPDHGSKGSASSYAEDEKDEDKAVAALN